MIDVEDINYREEMNFEIICFKMLFKFVLYYSLFEFVFLFEIKLLVVFVVKKSS